MFLSISVIVICFLLCADPVITLKPFSIKLENPLFAVSFFTVMLAFYTTYFSGMLKGKRDKQEEIIEMLNDLEAKATKTDIVS